MSSKTEKLFARFQAIYGGRWTACYASEKSIDLAIAEWSEVIERMSDEQLSRAITWAKTSCQWPPSIAEFLHAGLGIDEEKILQASRSLLSSWQRSHMGSKEMDQEIRVRKPKALQMLISEGIGDELKSIPQDTGWDIGVYK